MKMFLNTIPVVPTVVVQSHCRLCCLPCGGHPLSNYARLGELSHEVTMWAGCIFVWCFKCFPGACERAWIQMPRCPFGEYSFEWSSALTKRLFWKGWCWCCFSVNSFRSVTGFHVALQNPHRPPRGVGPFLRETLICAWWARLLI